MDRDTAMAIISDLLSLRKTISDEQALTVLSLYPTWKEGASYTVGDRVLYAGLMYKVLLDHTSQSDWTPDTASSLFTKVLIQDTNTICNWEQPDSTNPYMTGDKVKHNGFTWVSLIDNNVWEPSEALPTLWKKVTE